MNQLNEKYFETRKTHKRRFKKIGWIIWISLLVIVSITIFREIKTQLNSSIEIPVEIQVKNCLLEKEFKFGQIDYTFNYDSIINKLGKPDSIQIDEDLNSEILYYQDLNIGMTNNHIYYMWIKSSELSTPSGIKLGLEKNTINEKLQNNYSGKLEIDSEAKNVQIVNCKTEYYLVMDFESNILVKLEMGIDLP